MGVLGQELLSSMHAVQASLLEIEPVYSAVTVADVKKELERLLTESHVSPEQRSKMLAKFDAATASHERWDGLLKSFGEALDKGTNSIHEKLRKPVVRAAGSGGESWCCAAGWSVIGIGWKLKSKKIVEWGEDIVERCC